MSRATLFALALLYLLVIALALVVVTNRHHARQLFAEVQKLDKESAEISADWSRLKLEQSTLLNQVFVESRAKQELGMQKPSADNIKVLRE